MDRKKYLTESILLFALIFLTVFLAFKSNNFWQYSQWTNLMSIVSYRLILALGMSFIIATGGIDLSMGSIISLSGIFMGLSMKNGFSPAVSILIAVLGASLLGLSNGLLISFTKLHPFIITLSSSFMFRGLGLIITKGQPITKFPKEFLFLGTGKIAGYTPSVYIMLTILLIFIPLVSFTKWGLYLKILGSNEKALKRAGINCNAYKTSAYVTGAILASIVAVVITAQLNTAEANAGMSMEMDAITAVIMGGASLKGGHIKLLGVVLSVFLLCLIKNSLTILSISSYYQQFLIGLMLLISVLLSKLWEKQM